MYGYLYNDDDQYLKLLETSAWQDPDLFAELPPVSPYLAQEPDQQVVNFDYIVDRDISDSSVELITLSRPAWDTDADNQISQLPYQFDRNFDDIVYLIPLPYVLLEPDQQVVFFDYIVDRDLLDSFVEKITLPAPAWDTDADNQLPQLPYQFDKDIVDSSVEFITLPFNPWDAPEHIPYQLWQVRWDEVDTEVIWPVPVYNPPAEFKAVPASVINLSRKQRYWTWKAAMFDALGVETQPIVSTGWELTDTEQQMNQLPTFGQDELSDTGIELIQLKVGVGKVFDDIQELMYPDWIKDHLTTEMVEVIITPSFVTALSAWDNDGDNRLQQLPYTLDIDIVDAGVEKITVSSGWDTDADNQFQQPGWYIDVEDEREGVPKIILNPGIVREWDTDIGNMVPWALWVNDYQDFDLYQYIPPTVFVVPVIYNLVVVPSVALIAAVVIPSISVYAGQSILTQEIQSVVPSLLMSLSNVSCTPSMSIQAIITV
jgi:hypothetical protein